jgi:signal peptide peptidase SppA
MRFAHLVDKVFNTPLLLTPSKAEVISQIILGKIDANALDDEAGDGPIGPEASRFTGTRARQSRPAALVRAANGVALVDVQGSLVNRGAWVGSYSGLSSYEGIEASMKDAIADPEVHSIVLDINSPGGEANGMFGLAEMIRSAKKSKRIVAVVNDMAASAAYGIASAADEIAISPTSLVGSIGVVMMHLDRSGEMEKAGVRATLIHAGAHKVDGNSFGPLSEDVRADLQRSVDAFYDRFIETVALGREGRTTAEIARATEARVYIGAEAIAAGLADRIASLDTVLTELSQRPRAGQTSRGRTKMDTTGTTYSQQQMDDAVATAKASGKAEGVAEGEDRAYARVTTILRCDEAKGRDAQAQAIALDMREVSAESAKKLLATSPVAGSTVPSIEQRQAGQTGVNLSSDGPTADAHSKAASGWTKAVEQANRRFG